MKVYNLKDGTSEDHFPIDAREIVANDPATYSLTDPKADPKKPVETEGEVLARTAREQEEDSRRAHAQQRADASLPIRDTPAQIARKKAVEARGAANVARVAASNQGSPPPGISATPTSIAKLKADADVAEKRAKELEDAADKAEKDSAAADKAMRAQKDKEESAAEKAEKSAEKSAKVTTSKSSPPAGETSNEREAREARERNEK